MTVGRRSQFAEADTARHQWHLSSQSPHTSWTSLYTVQSTQHYDLYLVGHWRRGAGGQRDNCPLP